MNIKTLKMAFVLAIVVILAGCGGTVKSLLKNPEFQAENQPVRILEIVVATDGSHSKEEVERFVNQESDFWFRQTGIRFQIKYFLPDTIPEGSTLEELERLDSAIWSKRKEIDFAVDFTRQTLLSVGRCDFRTNCIVVRGLDKFLFLHEVGHLFGLGHSSSGLMFFMPMTVYLSEKDRTWVMERKWKNFRY